MRLIVATLLISLGSPYFIFSHSQTLLAQAPTTTSEEEITKAITLNSQGEGIVYKDLVSLDELNAGLEIFQQALTIFKKYKATAGEANSLLNIGYVYLQKGEYQKALDFLQPALAIRRKNRDRENEWIPLSYIAETYVNLNNYSKALDFYQPALAILREIKTANPKGYSYANSEKTLLSDIGAVYFRSGRYQKALDFYQQNLVMQKADNDRISSAEIMNNIGVVYLNLGNYAEALDNYQQALNTVQDFCYKEKLTCYLGLEAAILNNVSGVYFNLGQYQKALESLEKSAAIYKRINNSEYKNVTQRDIEILYSALGYNPQVLQQINSRANVGDAFGKDSFQFQGEALNLSNIGQIYLGLGKYDQALNVYQQALKIYKDNNYKSGIAFTLNNIGRIYQNQGKYDQAKELNQQALTNYREIGDRTGEGVTISNLGQVYQQQKQDAQALELYQQALAIHREVSDKVSESATLKFMGDVLSTQKQPQLAIAFYKQSVNITESIRQNLRLIPTNIQKSYTETVSERYRKLADLLLQQNRPAEAQEVLDLLKIQEVTDFMGDSQRSPSKTNNISNNNQRSPEKITTTSTVTVPLKPQEQEISQKYSAIQDKAISLGKELTNLRKIPQKNRTATQEKRISELVKLEQTITAEFNKFSKSPSVVSLVQQLSVSTGQENINLRQLNSIRDNLRQLNQKAVLLYPLVLDDRLELVIVSADAPPIHRTVQIKKTELNQLITEFRQSITNPRKSAKETANKLYNYLIKPIENDLKQADAKAIIYAPDDRLRYIPLAGLYDGKNWLAQRFIINNITSASLTKLDNKPQKNLHTLAAAFTKGKYTVKLGSERQAEFSGLEFAKVEVENLAKTIPGTKILLDNEFTPKITIPQMNDYKIVHLATHGLLVSGEPENSFIIFGDGDKATLRDIENWSLPNVDLVVLSACQTGLGEKLGNGQEILGLGYQIQLTGAKASVASLWSVSDGGTQALMNEFYQVLKVGNVTKAEALHKAQLALLTDSNKSEFTHPYYWAAFILIGNGL
ncbi:CHAT domain-containing protein [Anabaena sphaerica]|nr:tetratricopeptide repeat protein [Anabaena sphaerica]